MDWVVAPPIAPALLDHFARFGVERDAKAERRARVGVVGRGHAQIHDGVAFAARELFFLPDGFKKTPDAPIVQAPVEALAAPLAARVVDPGPALGRAMLGELVERVRPV